MTFRDAIEGVGKAVDVVGVATLVIGILVATWAATRTPRTSTVDRYRLYRPTCVLTNSCSMHIWQQ